jgi:SAM-dependent methyltransferase
MAANMDYKEIKKPWQFRPWVRKGHFRHFLDQMLLMDHFRYLYMKLRFVYFVYLRQKLSSLDLDTGDIAKETVQHNRKGLTDVSVTRSNALLKPLSAIEDLDIDSSILCIGPRTEGELFNLAANGFMLSNIRGIDLISYSPLIELGDMHNMKYLDSQWDAIVCGWVLAYSDNKKKAASELVRCCRPGGVIAIGIEYHPYSNEEILEQEGYVPGSKTRIESIEDLTSLFTGYIGKIYFSQQPDESRRGEVGSIVLIFSVQK